MGGHSHFNRYSARTLSERVEMKFLDVIRNCILSSLSGRFYSYRKSSAHTEIDRWCKIKNAAVHNRNISTNRNKETLLNNSLELIVVAALKWL
jgi:hypothetical protein